MAPDTLTPLKRARCERLLDAAQSVFLEAGFRGSSMEAIAAAAGMSKVTLYGYFPDKEKVFVAVVARFTVQLSSVFDAALAGKGLLINRISSALVAKHTAVFQVVRASTQAPDLFATQVKLAKALVDTADAQMIAKIATVLRKGGVRDSARLARLMFAAAQGIAAATTEKALAADIELLVRGVIAGAQE